LRAYGVRSSLVELGVGHFLYLLYKYVHFLPREYRWVRGTWE